MPGLAEAATDTSVQFDVLLARQPIFDGGGALHGYELLYRGGLNPTSEGSGDDRMTSQVLVNAFLSIGIGRLTGGRRAYLNFTRQLLLDRVHSVLHPGTVVIEVLERVVPDDEVLAACRDIVDGGYLLALDDFEYSPAMDPLLDLAHVVKLDVLGKDEAELAHTLDRLRHFNVRFLAERVETPAMRDACHRLGFSYFQGYYFARPELVSQRALPASPATIMKLMAMVRDDRTTEADLERAIQGDLTLTAKLLRAVNTVSVGGRGISSIRHALRLLGRQELRRWLALMLVTSVGATTAAERELLDIAMRRARMCEEIARAAAGEREAEAAFIVGLFSLLDAVLRAPMRDLLDTLNLAPELRAAIEGRTGLAGHVLSVVELFEQGAWDEVMAEAGGLGVSPVSLRQAYTDALAWTADRLHGPDMVG